MNEKNTIAIDAERKLFALLMDTFDTSKETASEVTREIMQLFPPASPVMSKPD